MSRAIQILLFQLPSVACVSMAGALALTDRSGWGWFLFGAVVLHVSIKFGVTDSKSK